MVEHKIKALREFLGLDQKQLCEKARVKSRYLKAIENGTYQPYINTLARIACALGVLLLIN